MRTCTTFPAAAISLVVFCAVYSFIFAFGVLYIYRLLRAGPVGHLILPPVAAIPNRPLSVLDSNVAAAVFPAARDTAAERAPAGE